MRASRASIMHLTFYLLLRIVLVALICLTASTAYVLTRSDRQIQQTLSKTATALSRQLTVQRLRIAAGAEQEKRFPDLDLWKETRTLPGICIRYASSATAVRRAFCQGAATADGPPVWFDRLLSGFYDSDLAVKKPVLFNGRHYGEVTVTANAEMVLSRAWDSFSVLMGLSAGTVLPVCFLVYAALHRALRPARQIVATLATMRAGDLAARLPEFSILEWRRIGAAINALAASQQQLLAERKHLIRQLMEMQEEERRFLVRELHDEMGQCLTAINAVAASITQTVAQECPAVIPEIEQVTRINRHMMDNLRSLLARLRPAELDELGLAACLDNLIAEWNARSAGTIVFRLQMQDDIPELPAPLPITLYRIVQEGLTNVARHSGATRASVDLKRHARDLILSIEDNGSRQPMPALDRHGLGLTGIRERIAALGGRFFLESGRLGGLALRVQLPLDKPPSSRSA